MALRLLIYIARVYYEKIVGDKNVYKQDPGGVQRFRGQGERVRKGVQDFRGSDKEGNQILP